MSLSSALLIATGTPLAAPLTHPTLVVAVQASTQVEESPPAEQAEDPAETSNVIVVTGEGNQPLKDPLVEMNEAAFKVTQEVDAALVEPLADVYENDVPGPIRRGLRNFLRNLLEPVNALNYFLQLKPAKAFETLGRFTVNSTVGIGGLIDVVEKKPFEVPFKYNGLGNTLGYYGVGPGPFLVLPLVGATSLRDLLGNTIDQAIVPFAVGAPFNTPYYAIPAYTVNSLEFRIQFGERIGKINDSDDPYYALRESYLCNREADIAALKNRPPPRDCSIEAIMLGPEPVAVATSGSSVAPEPAREVTLTQQAEPEPPAIVYVSREVVQPLPDGYAPPVTRP